MDNSLELLIQYSSRTVVTEPVEADTMIPHRGIIIIGGGHIGMAVAMNHFIHTCVPVLLVHDINEDVVIRHPLLRDDETSEQKRDDEFFQHLIEDTFSKITFIKEQAYDAMCYEYFEPRHQIIQNYRQPKIGRLNTKPKQIWWHRTHQRM